MLLLGRERKLMSVLWLSQMRESFEREWRSFELREAAPEVRKKPLDLKSSAFALERVCPCLGMLFDDRKLSLHGCKRERRAHLIDFLFFSTPTDSISSLPRLLQFQRRRFLCSARSRCHASSQNHQRTWRDQIPSQGCQRLESSRKISS